MTGPTLGAVVDALGSGVVRVLTAPHGLETAVGEPVVHDPVYEPAAGRCDLVLAVGIDVTRPSAVDVITRYGELGASAVLVKADGPLPAPLVAAAEAAGIALLAAPQDAAWGQLHTLLRTARSATGQRRQDSSSASIGDLFGLADAVSSLVGGATTIEDEHSTVLAYSSSAHPVDGPRRDTILGRRVPAEWLTKLTDLGVFKQLWASDEVVRVALDGISPRLAVSVRAGGEVLGSIWVQEGERPLGAEAEEALREAASMAALHLLRARSGEDLERRKSGELLRAVLEERLPAALLAGRLQVAATAPLVVIAVEPLVTDDSERVVLDRAVDLVVLSCRAFRRTVLAVTVDSAVYVVLPARTGEADEARQLAEDLARRVGVGLRLQVRAAASHEARGLAGLTTARREVDLALRVLRQRLSPDVVHIDDVRAATVLLLLSDLATEQPALLAGKLRLLEASDAEKSTSYIATLRAFLDAFGDVRVAADRVGVHPNTFRYRLRRLAELTSLDLDEPVERLVVHLQLHLTQS
ncbi:MAG TPA: helix-turn-helix domain-containing protein [Mycobacteriales bacterium]|nr:helix-turn-helix domain-containing protein [Mycobacteriales bacterium]